MPRPINPLPIAVPAPAPPVLLGFTQPCTRFFGAEPKKSFVYRKIHFCVDPNRTQPTQPNRHRIKHLRKFEKANTLILCPIN